MATNRQKARRRIMNYRRTGCKRPNKNSSAVVFRLDDIYRGGVWYPCYSARPKARTLAANGRTIKLPTTCEFWRDVAARLKKSQATFEAVMAYFGVVF